MKISVNLNHIKNGKRMLAHACPIALALKESGACNVSVDTAGYTYNKDGRKYSGSLPPAGKRFVKNFDNGRKVLPITLNLK